MIWHVFAISFLITIGLALIVFGELGFGLACLVLAFAVACVFRDDEGVDPRGW